MEAAASAAPHGDVTRLVGKLPSRVIVALDHFSPDDRAAVERAALAFAHGATTARRVSTAEPLSIVRATPTLLVLLRHEEGQPVVVEDILTQEAWNHLAHA